MHLLWAFGATAGLTEAPIEERTSEFYALEAVYALFAAATVVGVVMIAFRRGRSAPLHRTARVRVHRLRGAGLLGRPGC